MAGTQGQELKQKPCRHAAFWLNSHDSLNLLSETTYVHLSRDGTAHSELDTFTSIII